MKGGGNTEKVVKKKLSGIDNNLTKLSKLTAYMVQDKAFRNILYNEIKQQKTGDYEALYSELRSQKINGSPFTKYFKENIKIANLLSGKTKLGHLMSAIPKLHFAMPVNFEKWNPDTHAPVVTFAPASKDEDDVKHLTAFNSSLEKIRISSSKAPDYPLLVLGVNERVRNDKQNGKPGKNKENIIIINPGDGGGGEDEIDDERESGALDYIERIHVDNLHAYEPFWRGKADMWLQVAYSESSIKEDKKWKEKRSNLKDGFDPDMYIRNWYPDQYGDYCAYEFRERDYGGTYTHEYEQETEAGTISFEFQHEGGDEHFGTTVVNFEDPARRYDLGDLSFRLEFKNQ